MLPLEVCIKVYLGNFAVVVSGNICKTDWYCEEEGRWCIFTKLFLSSKCPLWAEELKILQKTRRAQDLAQTALYIAANSAFPHEFWSDKTGSGTSSELCLKIASPTLLNCSMFKLYVSLIAIFFFWKDAYFVKNEQVVKRYSFEQPLLASWYLKSTRSSETNVAEALRVGWDWMFIMHSTSVF